MTAVAVLGHVHASAMVPRRKIANTSVATKFTTVSSNPGIKLRPNKTGAWKVEGWYQYPQKGAVPDQPAESKEPFIDRLAPNYRIHRIVNICFA